MAKLKNFIQNWSRIDLDYMTYIITEDMCDVVVDSTKWVAPYNTSYGMTYITIKDWYWIERREWWLYRFIIDTKLVVVSATRNVAIRIWSTWTYIPVKNWANTILSWSTYFAKWRTDQYMYKTTYESWWALHLCAGSDTTYSALTVANITSSNTTAKVISWSIFNQWVKAVAVNNTAYAASWNWVTDVAPSKNAVYDKIEAVVASIPTVPVHTTVTQAQYDALPSTKTSDNVKYFISE